MNTKQLGNIGEAYALAKLVELGIPVYQQFGENEPADFIILVNDVPLKVQVKSSKNYNGEKTIFDLTSSVNGTRNKYSTQKVDVFLCYDIQTGEIFIIKNTGDMSTFAIRYTKPKNNQTKGINFYSDYILDMNTLSRVVLHSI